MSNALESSSARDNNKYAGIVESSNESSSHEREGLDIEMCEGGRTKEIPVTVPIRALPASNINVEDKDTSASERDAKNGETISDKDRLETPPGELNHPLYDIYPNAIYKYVNMRELCLEY